MADTLQKHLNGTDDTAIKAALVPKELGFNETDRSAVYGHEDGITFDTFPSESKLAETSTESGAALIGVDGSGLNKISGTQLQEITESIDEELQALTVESSVVVTNEAEFIAAVANPLVYRVECQKVVFDSTSAINLVGAKQIYTSVAEDLVFDTSIFFFSIDGSADVNVDFHGPITNNTTNRIVFLAGSISTTSRVRFEEIVDNRVDNVENAATNTTVQYERTNFIQGVPNTDFAIWTSQAAIGKLTSNVRVLDSASSYSKPFNPNYRHTFMTERHVIIDSLQSGTFYESNDCQNCVIDSSSDLDWSLIDGGFGASVTKDVQGFTFEYNIPSGTADGFFLGDYETSVTDTKGNKGYNGSSILSPLIETTQYEFRRHNVVSTDFDGSRTVSVGCYESSTGNFTARSTDDLSVLIQSAAGTYSHYKKAAPNVVGTVYALGSFTATPIA